MSLLTSDCKTSIPWWKLQKRSQHWPARLLEAPKLVMPKQLQKLSKVFDYDETGTGTGQPRGWWLERGLQTCYLQQPSQRFIFGTSWKSKGNIGGVNIIYDIFKYSLPAFFWLLVRNKVHSSFLHLAMSIVSICLHIRCNKGTTGNCLLPEIGKQKDS